MSGLFGPGRAIAGLGFLVLAVSPRSATPPRRSPPWRRTSPAAWPATRATRSTRRASARSSGRGSASPQDALTYVVYTRFNGGTGQTEVILARSRTRLPLRLREARPLRRGRRRRGPNGSDNFAFPAIDISADGKQFHVVALNLTQTVVVYTKNVSIEGAAWQTAWTQAAGGTSPRYDVVSPSAYGTTAPAIALDENRRPHVVWTRPGLASPFAPNVFYARHDGSAWSGEAPLSTINAGHHVPRGARPLDRHRQRLGARPLQGRPEHRRRDAEDRPFHLRAQHEPVRLLGLLRASDDHAAGGGPERRWASRAAWPRRATASGSPAPSWAASRTSATSTTPPTAAPRGRSTVRAPRTTSTSAPAWRRPPHRSG